MICNVPACTNFLSFSSAALQEVILSFAITRIRKSYFIKFPVIYKIPIVKKKWGVKISKESGRKKKVGGKFYKENAIEKK